ncbi:amidase [Rhodococcus sp. T2V]|uniref:amidase n=1 Tax=Rhodococcus sp. T2V TaxID=3034164 RepID=UPI0023E2CA16|nr:amidase [Rhodococcus sp. T2V]MDF3309642.1 amidase [Rhodococcus sp. T2V]
MKDTMAESTIAYDPASFEALRFHTVTKAFRAGEDSPRDYLERCLATIADREPVVQAWVVLNESGARAQADASAERWRRGEPLSLIDGMPIGIKDLLETRDMPTQMGSAAYAGNFPRRDNAAVWALRQAGAVVLGKTVTTEFGGPEPSKTTNPFNPRHTPGGSSSGSGAAVGARMVPATIATQTGSSLMRPASFSGSWGLKPTQGAINRGERQTASMTAHGVLAGCPEDMWLVAIEIASRAGGDPGRPAMSGPATTPPSRKPMTLAVMEAEGWQRLDESSRRAFERVIEQIQANGVTVLRRTDDWAVERFEQALDGATNFTNAMTAWEHYWALRDSIASNPDGFSLRTKRFFIEVGQQLGATGYEESLQRRAAVRATYANLGTRVDAVIAPSSVGPAPEWLGDVPGEELTRWPTGDPAFGMPSSLLGAPAVNVPMLSVHGLPLGVQVMGQPGTDARMVAIARWLGEALLPVST